MHSPTGILSLSQVTLGAGTPVTSQVSTRGLPATWLTVSVLGFSNVGGTAGERPDAQSLKALPSLPSSQMFEKALPVAGSWYFRLCH